jgi:hypothetical protein
LTEEEKQAAMRRHGIASEQRVLYRYGGRTYDRLQDALNYAKLVDARASEPGSSSA